MRVVLDTNIIISSYFSSSSPLARIRDYGQQGTYTLVISEELLAEYGKVLNYESVAKRHGMSAAKVAEEVSRIRGFSILVPLGEIPNVIPEDPDDNIVIATAVAGETT